MKDVNQKLSSPFAICVKLADGRITPIPMKVYEEDNELEYLYQYALIYCDKTTSQFANEEQFKLYLKSKFKQDYDIADIFLGKKEFIKDEDGNRIKDINGKEKYTYKKEEFGLIYNNEVLKNNALWYADKKEKQKGETKNIDKSFVNENNFDIRSFIDDFLYKGYVQFMEDEYVTRTLSFRTVANLEELNRCLKENSPKYAFVSSKLREMILNNYSLFRYIYVKSNERTTTNSQEINENNNINKVDNIIKENINFPVVEEESGKTINDNVGTELTMGKEELLKVASNIINPDAKNYFIQSDGDAEGVVYAMGEDAKQLAESDKIAMGISDEMISKAIEYMNEIKKR